MKRIILIGAAALSLAACNGTTTTTISQTEERADTEALSLYAAIGTALNVYEQANPSQATAAEKFRSTAWGDLMVVNAAYQAGQAIDLTKLQADLTAAKAGQIQ
jgi:hypothetical protein